LILTVKFHSFHVKESGVGVGVGNFGKVGVGVGDGYFTSDSATWCACHNIFVLYLTLARVGLSMFWM